ncbi:IDEAL domain-containing protein [Neobacillus sp. D3-1R]|uniref:IDEAL domain-containing protein n=1 Tax=Neobacillus sp. D3-1R TaxID=3445778 RepID=UPI003FA08E87
MKKNYYLNPPQHPDQSQMDSIFAEMVLDKALRDFQVEKIQKEIDLALQNLDKDNFLILTEELKKYL